jgi:hypothetical protein
MLAFVPTPARIGIVYVIRASTNRLCHTSDQGTSSEDRLRLGLLDRAREHTQHSPLCSCLSCFYLSIFHLSTN